jgi:hypothetical protein
MPQIIVTSGHGDEQTTVTLRERVNASDFESACFATNLVERLGWAVGDATEAESERSDESDEQQHRPQRRGGPRRNGRITGERRSAEDPEQHLEPVGSA